MTCKDVFYFPPHSWNFMSQAKQMTHISVEQPTSTNLARTVSKDILNFPINLDMSLFSNTLTKGVFHHDFDILGNNSNELYSVTKEKKKISLYLHLTDMFFFPLLI